MALITSDCVSFSRCVISVNECDPLRDEGLNFYRLCTENGVAAQCRMVCSSRRPEFCHFAGTPSSSLLERPLKGEGGAAE